MKISIIIPVLNDAHQLAQQLARLQEVRQSGHEVIVVDGGSSDETTQVQDGLCDIFSVTRPGRARQMNRGAELARGDSLLFLHADTCLPPDFSQLIERALHLPGPVWGRFDIRLSGAGQIFTVIAWMMNLRSHVSGVVTGDQGLFVLRQAFHQVGGYPDIPLMEDVALSKKLRRVAWPVRIRTAAVTSSWRWEQRGIVPTILLMWWLRLLYFCGARPASLARKYYGRSS